MSLKMLREELCLTESEINTPPNIKRAIANLIPLIDEHRPLGPDGKHDNRHTATCGCDL